MLASINNCKQNDLEALDNKWGRLLLHPLSNHLTKEYIVHLRVAKHREPLKNGTSQNAIQLTMNFSDNYFSHTLCSHAFHNHKSFHCYGIIQKIKTQFQAQHNSQLCSYRNEHNERTTFSRSFMSSS